MGRYIQASVANVRGYRPMITKERVRDQLTNIEITAWKSEQQLICSLTPFIGPNSHGDRRDETKQNMGKESVELVKVCEVGIKKLLGPKRGQSTG